MLALRFSFIYCILQSPKMNHLDVGPPGGAVRKMDLPVNATRMRVHAGGHVVYGAFFES